MIACVQGPVSALGSDSVLVLAGAVGYEVFVSPRTHSECLQKASQVQTLLTYTIVREDALQLIGFLTWEEREFFQSLLKVNGVGPKMALNVIGGAPLADLKSLIEAEDVKALSQFPKVGKKTAEQIILALKGKFVNLAESSPKPALGWKSDARSILLNLGFRSQEVDIIEKEWSPEMDLNAAVKFSLQKLSSQGGRLVP